MRIRPTSRRSMMTYTGRTIDPLHLKDTDVSIEDIAHSLSCICRFGGHSEEHYSVAEHSLYVEALLDYRGEPDSTKLWGLLHDASEAYLGDVPRPYKSRVYFDGSDGFSLAPLSPIADVELQVLGCVRDAFGLVWPIPLEVHRADVDVLEWELAAQMGIEVDVPTDVSLVVAAVRASKNLEHWYDVEKEFTFRFGDLMEDYSP